MSTFLVGFGALVGIPAAMALPFILFGVIILIVYVFTVYGP